MIDVDMIQTAFSDMIARAVAYLPSLLTAVVLLLAGWVVARLLARLARGLARRLGLDAAVERSGLAEGLREARIMRPASDLIGLLLFWLVFLSFLLIALENLGLTMAILPLQSLIAYLPRLVAALLTLILGSLLAQLAGKAIQAAAIGMGIEFHQGLGRAARGLLLVLVVIIAVDQLGINIIVLTDLLTGVVIVVVAGLALAFGLGGREVARNVLAGYYARELFSLGDRLSVDGQEGTLEAIGTLNAEISLTDGRLVIPNTLLTEGKIRIYTET